MKIDNIKEQAILNLRHRYLIFLDEVGDPTFHRDRNIYKDPAVYPVMTITAIIVSKAVYEDILYPGLDRMKMHFFNTKKVHFHSREIRRKDGIFKKFLNEKTYSEFKTMIDALINRSSITVISSSIKKLKLLEKAMAFEKNSGQKYNIGDLYLRNAGFVFERIGHFLNTDTGKIIFETRGRKESKRIQAVLNDAKLNGTFYCGKDRFKNIDEEILFFDKKDNINGLQVADYSTYPFSRHAKNPRDIENKFFDFLRQFIYKGNYAEYGLKEWP